jgi:hypothetical protein
MPRDFHLLPDHSQQLLRAARAGRVSKPTSISTEDETENKDEEGESKDSFGGFTVKKYSKVARHLEGPEPEYLAKRRKGLPSAHSVYTSISGQTANTAMRKTKVKKIDAEGNPQVYEVLVPEGQAVEGEIKEEEATVAEPVPAALPGTVVDGVGVVNHEGLVVASDLIQPTPPKRRPPPPKKKKKHGPGRGKKKVIFAPDGEGALGTPGDAQSDGLAVPSTKTDGTPVSGVPSDGDTPMGEAHEAEDDEDEGEEGEEGEEGDEGDEDEDLEDGELPETPAQTPPKEETPADVPAAIIPPVVHLTSPIKDSVPASFPSPVQPPPISPILSASGAPATLEVPPMTNRDPSSSPEMPLVTEASHSRQGSLNGPSIISPIVAEVPEHIVHMDTQELQPETIPIEVLQAPALIPEEIQAVTVHPEEVPTEEMQIDEVQPLDIEMGDIHTEQLHHEDFPSGEAPPVDVPAAEFISAEAQPESMDTGIIQSDMIQNEVKASDEHMEVQSEAPLEDLLNEEAKVEALPKPPADDMPLESAPSNEDGPTQAPPEEPQPEVLQPEVPQSELPQPEAPPPEEPQPEEPQAEMLEPEELEPEAPRPEQSRAEEPSPQDPQPEELRPEEPQPEHPQQEDAQPMAPQPEEPLPQPVQLEEALPEEIHPQAALEDTKHEEIKATEPPNEEPHLDQAAAEEASAAPVQADDTPSVELPTKENAEASEVKASEGEPDLLGSLERHLDGESKPE